MKVSHICTHDFAGGAARAASRIHMGLRGIGVHSEMLVADRSGQVEAVRSFARHQDIRHRMSRIAARWSIGSNLQLFRPLDNFELFSTGRSDNGIHLAEQLNNPDIINLHWFIGMADIPEFVRHVSRYCPLFWTLHDMNAFTGGCHYDEYCGRFTGSCGQCPQLQSKTENDLSRGVWIDKESSYGQLSQDDLTIITPSRWLRDECQRSSLLGRFRIEVIPYGLCLNTFQPRNSTAVRHLEDVPLDAFVVLALADGFALRRKGFSFMEQLIESLSDRPDIYFLFVGSAADQMAMRPNVRVIPKTHNERHLSFIYSAANAFVIPTLQDNLPNTILESIACGTPVIGFDSGGVRDAVRPNETGFLVDRGNTAGLARAIMQLREDPSLQQRLAIRCRAIAEEEYAMNLQATRYRKLYEETMEKVDPRPAGEISRQHG